MRRRTSSEIAEMAEQRLIRTEEVFAKYRLFLGLQDWLNEWLCGELPDVRIPTREEAKAQFERLSDDRKEYMNERIVKIVKKFNGIEAWLEANRWDAMVILACFGFDEERIKEYVAAETATTERLEKAAEVARVDGLADVDALVKQYREAR